jgi:hypothetical protein
MPIIDVGGGASTLVDDLSPGLPELTVTDISHRPSGGAAPPRTSRPGVMWRWKTSPDGTPCELRPLARPRRLSLSHAEADRRAYIRRLCSVRRRVRDCCDFRAARPGKCSGLSWRYSADELHDAFGSVSPPRASREHHQAPWGAERVRLLPVRRNRRADACASLLSRTRTNETIRPVS